MTRNEPQIHAPTRGCAACRARLPLAEVVRFALDGDRVVVDVRRRYRGRGVNLGPSRACLELAVRKNAFARGFRRQVARVDADVLAAQVAEACAEHLAALLEGARRGGDAVPVDSDGEVWPPELQSLRRELEGTPLGRLLPRVQVRSAGLSSRAGALARRVSEFTFRGRGVIAGRPQSPEPCQNEPGRRRPRSEKA
ncbi:MAG: DUF448 domain-containing protein [Deltaproteobacteria bacterium]|nr:DUF448 domain-containing protein [Deltaproteobacteria bacterium]